MPDRSRTRVRPLLLALLLALGSGLSLVHGSLMAAEMAISADGDHAGPSGCDDCRSQDCETDAPACLALCGSAAQGLLPGEPTAAPPIPRPMFEAVGLASGGWSHSPEHGPPKLVALG